MEGPGRARLPSARWRDSVGWEEEEGGAVSAAEKFLSTTIFPRPPALRGAGQAPAAPRSGQPRVSPPASPAAAGRWDRPRHAVHLRSAPAAARSSLPGSGAGRPALPGPARLSPSAHGPAFGRTAVAQPLVSLPAPGKLSRTPSRGDGGGEPWEPGLARRPRS